MTNIIARISVSVFTILLVVGFNSLVAQPGNAGEEGIEPQVWDVEMIGNDTFSDIVLKSRIATETPSFWKKLRFWNRSGFELDEREIKKDVIRLQNFYRRRGFSGVRVRYEIQAMNREWKNRVVITIDENPPIRISEMEFLFVGSPEIEEFIRNHSEFAKASANHAYRKGMRYEKVREPEVIGRFADVLKNMGFAFAEVNLSVETDPELLSATITIECIPGPLTNIDTIIIEGSTSVSDDYIIRETGLKIGNRFSLNALQEAQQELFNHHLFRFATISIPDQEQDSTLTLLLRIRENELHSIEASVGFGTEEKARGQLSWSHRNVFDRGHRLSATARASFIEQTASSDYLIPYVFNTKSNLVFSPFIQHLLESNYELFRGGVTNSFIYTYSRDLTGTVSYQFTKNLELSKQFNTSLPDTTREYDLSSLQFIGYYSQGFGREGQGWVIKPYGEISGFFGFAEFSFQKLSIDVRRFTNLTSSTVLAARVQGGGLFSAGTDSLPNNIRFYLGGTNSVRGWYRNQLGPKEALIEDGAFIGYIPLGGRALFSFNLELRQELNSFIKGFGTALFFDGGQVWRGISSADLASLQFGAGGGFRYQSPIGPMRIDIGYKLNPSDKDLNMYQGQDFGNSWDRIGIHFSLGQAF